MFCYIRKKFFIDYLQTYFDFFNEMPRNLMIFGTFAFFVFFSLRYFCTATLGRKRNSGTFSTVSQLVENYFFDKLRRFLL